MSSEPLLPDLWRTEMVKRLAQDIGARVLKDITRGSSELGVTSATVEVFAQAGITPEPGSVLQDLMVIYDDTRDTELRKLILSTARRVHKLTPFACCRMVDE